METKPITWSFSSLQKFKNCPKRYYEERVAKSVKQTPTEATNWGERIHAAFDNALKTDTPLEADLKPYSPVVERFAKTKGTLHSEQKLAITSSFKPTGYLAKDVWCRAVLDAVWIDKDVARVVDWKSGRRKRNGSYQLKLSSLILFAHHPQVDRVNTGFVWLQTGKMDVEKYYRKDIPILWQDILPDVRRLEYAHRTMTFVPKPGPLCRWCPVKKCSFWISEDGTGGQRAS